MAPRRIPATKGVPDTRTLRLISLLCSLAAASLIVFPLGHLHHWCRVLWGGVRAWLQPCRKRRNRRAALAAEVCLSPGLIDEGLTSGAKAHLRSAFVSA